MPFFLVKGHTPIWRLLYADIAFAMVWGLAIMRVFHWYALFVPLGYYLVGIIEKFYWTRYDSRKLS